MPVWPPSPQVSFCTPLPAPPAHIWPACLCGPVQAWWAITSGAICMNKSAPPLPIPAPKGMSGGHSALVRAVGGSADARVRVRGFSAPGMCNCSLGCRSPFLPPPPPCSLQVADLTPALSPANPSHTESSQPASGSCFTGMLASNLRSEMNSLSDYFYL